MKTGKKILALLLVFCFMFTAVPAFAADYSNVLTNNVDNDLWGKWDADATISDLDVTVKIDAGGIALTFADTTIQKLLKDTSLGDGYLKVKGYSVTLPEIVLGEGENTVTIPGGTFKINTTSGLWITTYFPTNGTIANAMVEESKTDEELQKVLTMDATTGAASLATGQSVFATNVNNYIKYKTGLTALTAAVKATLHAGGTFKANGDFPLTSFFVADQKINTYVGGETPWVGAYADNNSGVGLLSSTVDNSKLDGPYTVFTAPADGVYDVFAAKRDDNTSANAGSKNQRHVELDIAGETYSFSNTNAPSTMGYYWEPAADQKPISLTKGQQVTVRILAETGSYAGCYGIAFAPRADAETPVTIQHNASPLSDAALNDATIETAVPAAQTATVKVEGVDVAITAGAAESYYPNVRKSDANGNYIDQPTLLDALVAVDKQEDIGFEPHILTDSNVLYTSALDSLALSPDTYAAHGVNWITGSAGGYNEIWGANEIFFGGATTMEMYVKVPENGTYFMIASGNAWDPDRNITARIDGQYFYTDAGKTNNKFIPGGEGKAGVYKVQSAHGYELTAGYHKLTVATKGTMRMNYVALVKADSQAEAAEIQATFTDKETFNAYMNQGERGVFDGSTVPGLNVSVNNKIITEDWDRYILSEGDEILLNVFEPVSVGGKVYAYTSNLNWDNNRQLTAETREASNFAVMLSSYGNMPVDVTVKDSMRGMYLTGYLTNTADDASTTGDETQVANYIHYEIQGNAISEGRLVIAIKQIDANYSNTVFDGLVYKNLAGSFVNESKIYNASQLYITDHRFNGDATIKAEYEDGKVVISSKKPQPIFVTVKNADGTKASAANYALNVTAPVEVEVEAGQTVYVWEGTPYIASGTSMKPLCAPVTAPVAE